MERTVTKKVRMSRVEAARLRALAREEKQSESDLLREGFDLVERKRRRARGIAGLIAMIDGPPPPKVRFRMR